MFLFFYSVIALTIYDVKMEMRNYREFGKYIDTGTTEIRFEDKTEFVDKRTISPIICRIDLEKIELVEKNLAPNDKTNEERKRDPAP